MDVEWMRGRQIRFNDSDKEASSQYYKNYEHNFLFFRFFFFILFELYVTKSVKTGSPFNDR